MDIFQFPFHADVWGTVSDWVMVTVTAITAYFLYNTLKSQKEVQHVQNTLLRIEQIRLQQDYKPDLIYGRVQMKVAMDMYGPHIITIMARNQSANNAEDVQISYDGNCREITLIDEPRSGKIITGEVTLIVNFQNVSHREKQSVYDFTFDVFYCDTAGTKYKQTVHCKNDLQSESIIPSKTEILT